MPWERDWDGVCQVYDSWDADGATWTVEDLHPEHDGLAVDLMITHLLAEEEFCARAEVKEDAESVSSATKFWTELFPRRVSLACYRQTDGRKELAGVNACLVRSIDDETDTTKIVGEKWRLTLGALYLFDTLIDSFKVLKVKEYLGGAGLLVIPKYRGMKLGQKILAAREPMCKSLGVRATSTVFTGPASQKSAAKVGFRTVLETSFDEIAAAGFYLPGDQKRLVKVMVKNYDF